MHNFHEKRTQVLVQCWTSKANKNYVSGKYKNHEDRFGDFLSDNLLKLKTIFVEERMKKPILKKLKLPHCIVVKKTVILS